jgi:hypothetical protein
VCVCVYVGVDVCMQFDALQISRYSVYLRY